MLYREYVEYIQFIEWWTYLYVDAVVLLARCILSLTVCRAFWRVSFGTKRYALKMEAEYSSEIFCSF
jgi:hypothetical protein